MNGKLSKQQLDALMEVFGCSRSYIYQVGKGLRPNQHIKDSIDFMQKANKNAIDLVRVAARKAIQPLSFTNA